MITDTPDSGSLDVSSLATFTPGQWADSDASADSHGVRVTVTDPSGVATLTTLATDAHGTTLAVASATPARVTVRLDVPLGHAAGFWHPDAGWARTLPADWSDWREVSLVESAPVGCLYDVDDTPMLAYACDRLVRVTAVRFGVSEERKRFGVWLLFDLEPDQPALVRVGTGMPTTASALRSLARWLAAHPGYAPLPVPEFGRTPVYSTWYSFTQDVSAAAVEAEAAIAAELGCGQIFLDDGWQRGGHGRGYGGCGDWTPDEAKFPDFTAHVAAVRALGLRYTAWIAPLLLGVHSDAFATMAAHASHEVTRLDCRVLDPRRPETRAFVIDSCVRLVERHGLDGLKVDFLDEAVVYAGADIPADAGAGFIADVGEAMAEMLGGLRAALHEVRGGEFVIELRQKYVGPAMAAFGNVLRANDCPADAVANRVRTLDIGHLAGEAAVHSDMIMWDPAAAHEAVAWQLHGALHSVPQLSARLADLPADHLRTVAFWLGLWRQARDILTRGQIDTGRADELYPVVSATDGAHAVVTCYAQRPIALGSNNWTTLLVVNSTTADHVVLDLAGSARAVRLQAHDASGTAVAAVTMDLRPGLNRLPVPRFGLCRITAVNCAAGQRQTSSH